MDPTSTMLTVIVLFFENPEYPRTHSANNATAVKNENLINDSTVFWIMTVLSCVASILSVGGMCTNVINIIVCYRQGPLHDSSNTTLMCLAIADFCGVFTVLGTFVLTFISYLKLPNLSFVPDVVMVMVFGRPHALFSTMTSWITAYLAFERCICVVFPFKVKSMFTAKRSLAVIIVLCSTNTLMYIPFYISYSLGWVYDPLTNTTILTTVQREVVGSLQYYIETVGNTTFRTVSVFVVYFFTQITLTKILSSNKWRKRITQTGDSNNRFQPTSKQEQPSTSYSENKDKPTTNSKPSSSQPKTSKDMKLVRMVASICTLYLICYTPDMMTTFLRLAFPTINFGNVYHNLYIVLYGTAFFLETINSSSNIFIYYRQSTRYKMELRRLFNWNEGQ